MERTQELEEQSQDVHATHEEPASVHTEPLQDDRDAEDMQDQQSLGADAYKPPPQEHHAKRHSRHQAIEGTIHE
jgi:hypothetical protein